MSDTGTSTFFGTLVIGDDIRRIEVDATGGGPEQVAVVFTLPNYTALPRLYLAPGKARELRDRLTAALDDVESDIIVAAGFEANFPADLAIVQSYSKPGVTP